MNAEQKGLVVKDNALVNAMCDLSLQATRFLAFAISKIDHLNVNPEKSLQMEIHVSEFAEIFNLDIKSAYREVEILATQLQKKIIQFRKGERRIKVGIISRQEYIDLEGRVFIKFDETIVPYLIGLSEQFTKYMLKDVYQFKSVSTWRLYELLKQFHKIGQREIDIDELKWKLNIEDKYDRIGNLKIRIIEPSVKEINELSDILVTFSQKKRGRRVVSFIFDIVTKQAKTREDIINNAVTKTVEKATSKNPDLARFLREKCGIGATQAKELANYAVSTNQIALLEALAEKLPARYDKLKEKKTTPGGYAYKAIKAELMQQNLLKT